MGAANDHRRTHKLVPGRLHRARRRYARGGDGAMKIHNVEQGSADWIALRIGIPTASQFHKIITPKTLELSSQARRYAFFLVAEKLMNESLNPLENLEWIERGKLLEPQAVKMYEFDQEVSTMPVGFLTTDDGRIGASPDRLIVDQAAALELKCPAPHTHLEYLIDGFGADYMAQVQGQAYVGDFEWVDRYSFHPLMPSALMRTYRDEAYIKKLADALARFVDMKDELLEQARGKGYFGARDRLITAVDEMAKDQDLGRYLDA
jgi:hypothetical protein